MKLLYVFPEPLPLQRARGIQTVHTVAALAAQGADVTLAYVPSSEDPFTAYSVARPGNVRLLPESRSLPWPLTRTDTLVYRDVPDTGVITGEEWFQQDCHDTGACCATISSSICLRWGPFQPAAPPRSATRLRMLARGCISGRKRATARPGAALGPYLRCYFPVRFSL